MNSGDTIVALSSGATPSGVAVIRISGPRTRALLQEVAGRVPEPRRLTMLPLSLDGDVIDRGLVAWFPSPSSFTGEDVAELQVHGSPAIVRRLLRGLSAMPGLRLAEAGEFTRRAFLNGKLDLVETEGLGDLILAETEAQRRLARMRAEGSLSRHLEAWREELLSLRAEIEARLDFSDESDVDDELPADFFTRLAQLGQQIEGGLASVSSGRIVREGFRVVLMGAPNAGKSSLLNALTDSDIAIVTDEPGTTRDVREVSLDLDGHLVVLVDTAGLRVADSKAEAEGVRRAEQAASSADLILMLQAPDTQPVAAPPTAAPTWLIGTKADLERHQDVDLELSSLTGEGVATLLEKLSQQAMAASASNTGLVFSHERDRSALSASLDGLRLAGDGRRSEFVAEGLRQSAHALERLLGRMDTEDVLDQLFSRFCIGK